MIYQKIKELFLSSVELISSEISKYSVNPDTDFRRNRKISPQSLISFLVSQGSSSTKVEMLDFWGMDTTIPTSFALNQQRGKLKPDALEAVFHQFNSSVMEIYPNTLHEGHYRFLAADGSTCTYFSTPSFSSDDYYCSSEHSIRGFYSMHLNAFFDLTTHTYTDVLIQPVYSKNEFSAFCDIVDRHVILDGRKNVYIGDRGYCSYNNMAHVIEQNQYFLLRSKDIHSNGLVANFDFPEEESFDIDVKVTLVRSHFKKFFIDSNTYRRFIDQESTFDYIEYGSFGTYGLTFRIVRFPISESAYECIVTNPPRNEFPAAHICRVFLRLATKKDQYDVMSLLQKELIPIRNERQYPRLKTAHFLRPRYFIYRAA